MTLGPRNMDVFPPEIFFINSFWPTFVFQLFSLRTFSLKHDSKLHFLSVVTLQLIFRYLLEFELYISTIFANIKYN